MKREIISTLILSALLAASFILGFPPMEHLELKSIDARFALRGKRTPPGNVVIVAIDEKSLKREGRWPWPRSKIALLLEKLSAAHAVAVDVGFFEPGKGDERLASALKRMREKAVLSYFLHTRPVPTKTSDFYGSTLEKAVYPVARIPSSPFPEMSTPELGPRTLFESVERIGYFNIFRDRDGITRRYPMVLMFKKRPLAPLAVQTVACALNDDPFIMASRTQAEAGVGDVSVPITPAGMAFLNFYGPPKSFTHISASDLMEGRVPASVLKGKIVVLGATATGLFDNHATPFGNSFPGPEIHATAVANLITGSFLKPPGNSPLITLIATFSLPMIVCLATAEGAAAGLFVMLLSCTGYLLAAQFLFSRDILINLSYPTVSPVLSYILNLSLRYSRERGERKILRDAFSRYLHPKIVEEIVKNPGSLRLGGEKREITVLFADIRGFTSTCESADPERMVEALNLFFSEMTETITRHGGLVDKFIGDCVMAVFGAPLPARDHRERATEAAVEMAKRAEAISETWEKLTGHPLKIGIGIATGDAVVGNVGCKGRLNYTVLGDAVNLASRLEAKCREFSPRETFIIACSRTVEGVKNVYFRRLGEVSVKGKKRPVEIYEIAWRPSKS